MRQGQPTEVLKLTPALVGDGARGHRTAIEEGGGLPPSSEASRSSPARTEDRGEDDNGIEEESRVNIVSRGEFQLRKGLIPYERDNDEPVEHNIDQRQVLFPFSDN